MSSSRTKSRGMLQGAKTMPDGDQSSKILDGSWWCDVFCIFRRLPASASCSGRRVKPNTTRGSLSARVLALSFLGLPATHHHVDLFAQRQRCPATWRRRALLFCCWLPTSECIQMHGKTKRRRGYRFWRH